MTRNTSPWVGLVLCLLLVTSPLAGVASAVDPAAYDADSEVSDDGYYWLGQTLVYADGIDASDDTVRLRDSSGETLVKELAVTEDSVVTFETDELSTGDYFLESEDGERLSNFSVAEQSLNATLEENSTENRGVRSDVNLTIDSSRNSYDLAVADIVRDNESVDLSRNTLSGLFEGEVEFRDYDEDGDVEPIVTDISSTQTLGLSFDDFQPGEYEFEFTPVDTPANASVDITVNEFTGTDAEFSSQFIDTHRGNIVDIPLTLYNTDEATVRIGGESVGYTATVNVIDGNEDGNVTLRFDTGAAGEVAPSNPVISANGTNDEVQVVSESSLDNKLDSAQYLLRLSASGEEKDLSGLRIQPIEFNNATAHAVPGDAPTTDLDAMLNTSTPATTASMQDKVLVHFDVQGMNRHLLAADEAADFTRDSKMANVHYVYATAVETQAEANKNPRTLDIGRTTLYEDKERGGVFLLLDPQSYENISEGETFDFSLNLMDDNEFVENDTVLTTNVTFTEAETNLEMNSNDKVELSRRNGQVLNADTTLAPNSSVTVVARSPNEYPFHKEVTGTVGPNGSFNVTFDMGDIEVPVGYEYHVEVDQTGENETGIITEYVPPAPDENSTNNSTANTTVNAMFTASSPQVSVDEPVQFDASASTPQEEITTYTWRFDDGTSEDGASATTHRFENPGTYFVQLVVTTADGEQATATQPIEVTRNDSNVTTTTTTAPVENNSSTVEEPSVPTTTVAPGQPGFGVALFVAALLAGLAIAARRDP